MKNKKLLLGVTLLLVTFLLFISKNMFNNKKPNTINNKTKTMAIYIKQEDGTYEKSTDIPQSGYTLNSEKSKCSNGATPGWDTKNNRFYTDNLTKGGTSCYLYFDKLDVQTSSTIIANLNAKTTAPDFTQVATTDEGVYATSDGMYGGTTYYWRGATTNNYVTFAGFCWRIVRINGDGSIRLIYDGTTCHANGTSTAESIAISSTAYNGTYDNSSYVGWSYSKGSQRPNNTNPQTGGTRAPIRVTLEDTWYKTNITDKGYDGKVATGKHCNDRNTKNNETWRATGDAQYYAAYQRLSSGTKTPTTSCPAGDVYETKVGLITADEVQFAGASWTTTNKQYYLYNGQYYWTMSPYNWWNSHARVFLVWMDGSLDITDTDGTTGMGIRPVINLNSDTTFQPGGDGTIDHPYVVE